MSEATGDLAATDIEQVAAELRSRDRFLLTAHEGPDGDALGSLLGMHHLLTQLGKDSVMFMAAKEFPLPIEYRFLPLEEVFHEPPADMADRTVVFLDCGNIDRMPVDFLTAGEQLRDQHRPPPRQHPLRRPQPGRHRGLLHGRDRLRAGDPARGRDHAGDRLGPLRRPGHRHRQVHVREHQRPHPPDRRRADRSRGRRRRHLPPPLRARADREAAAGRRAPWTGIQRHCDERLVAHLHHRRRLRGERRRRGDDRGDHRPPALDRGRQGRGA